MLSCEAWFCSLHQKYKSKSNAYDIHIYSQLIFLSCKRKKRFSFDIIMGPFLCCRIDCLSFESWWWTNQLLTECLLQSIETLWIIYSESKDWNKKWFDSMCGQSSVRTIDFQSISSNKNRLMDLVQFGFISLLERRFLFLPKSLVRARGIKKYDCNNYKRIHSKVSPSFGWYGFTRL